MTRGQRRWNAGRTRDERGSRERRPHHRPAASRQHRVRQHLGRRQLVVPVRSAERRRPRVRLPRGTGDSALRGGRVIGIRSALRLLDGGRRTGGAAPYGTPAPDAPAYGTPAAPAYGTAYGTPAPEAPAYGAPAYGQPTTSTYGQPAYGTPNAGYGYGGGYIAPARTNVLAIISLVASLVGFVLILPVVGSIAGVIMGHISLKQIKDRGERGRGMALAGVIIGYVTLLFVILFVIGISILIASAGTSGSRYGA